MISGVGVEITKSMQNFLFETYKISCIRFFRGVHSRRFRDLGLHPSLYFYEKTGDDSLWACSFALAAVFGGLGISAFSWSSSVHASPFNHTLRKTKLITVERLAEEAVCARCLPG